MLFFLDLSIEETQSQPIEYIQLTEPIEIDCFLGITKEPTDPISFNETINHLGWCHAM